MEDFRLGNRVRTPSSIGTAAAVRQPSIRAVLIGDDAIGAALVCDLLRQHGFAIDHVRHVAMSAVRPIDYDVVILEFKREGIPSELALKELRRQGCSVPLLMLSGSSGLSDRIAALNAGADAVLSDPCDPDELVARLRALGRRPRDMLDATLACSNLMLHLERRELTVDGKPIGLGDREFRLVERLMHNAGRPMAKELLLEKLYGFDQEIGSNLIEVNVYRVRKRLKLAGAQVRIENRRNMGYALLPASH